MYSNQGEWYEQTWFYLLVSVLIFCACIGGMSVSANNSASGAEIDISKARSDMNVLQVRRVKLFTELIDATKASTSKEEEILKNITALRAQGKSLSSSISLTAEAYPELKSISNYNTVMTEMSLTENGLAAQSVYTNGLITDYNKMFVQWPSSMFLSGHRQQNFSLYQEDFNSNYVPTW